MGRKRNDDFEYIDTTEMEAEEFFSDNGIDISGDDDDMPECCRTCGGNYPHCIDSCKIFDD